MLLPSALILLHAVSLTFAADHSVSPVPTPIYRNWQPKPTPSSPGIHVVARDASLQKANQAELDTSIHRRPQSFCPESLGGPLLSCASCGGEDPKTKGKCKSPLYNEKIPCGCTNVNKDGHTTSVITATVGKETVKATFELVTLTEYKNLKQEITVTKTATQTGGSPLETVAVVLFAGGVTWVLVDGVEAEAAAEVINPPEDAPDHGDDKSCPDKLEACKDCGGKDHICTTEHPGCGCEEEKCPADGSADQSICHSDDCKGDKDGKCTTGDHQRCKCKTADCPDLKKTPMFCDDCGGPDDKGKCRGAAKSNNLYKDCTCLGGIDWSEKLIVSAPPDYADHLKKLIEHEGKESKPTCDSNKVTSVPADKFSPVIYKEFCDKVDGLKKGQGLSQVVGSDGKAIPPKRRARRGDTGDSISKFPIPQINLPPPVDLHLYTFDLQYHPHSDKCQDKCSTVFKTMADSDCGKLGSGIWRTMAVETQYHTNRGSYHYKINVPKDAGNSPPNKREPQVKDCNKDSSPRFNRDLGFQQARYTCTDLVDNKVTLNEKQKTPTAKVWIEKDHSTQSGPNGGISDKGTSFILDLQWNKDACEDEDEPQNLVFGKDVTREECEEAFRVTIDDCGAKTQGDDRFWKVGGTVAYKCAMWTTSVVPTR